MGRVAVEHPRTIVVVGGGCSSEVAWICFIRFDARERKMSVEPTELSIVELRMQCNLVARIFRNVETIVRRVGCSRRNQMHVNHRARRPGIPLVDGIAVAAVLQGTTEMGARPDRPLTAA